ncbi:MAG: hypothetical protein ABJA50_08685, partial [Chloroflexota bacterium]
MIGNEAQPAPDNAPQPQVPRRGLRSSVSDWIAGLRGGDTASVSVRMRDNDLVVDTDLLKKLDRLSLSVG